MQSVLPANLHNSNSCPNLTDEKKPESRPARRLAGWTAASAAIAILMVAIAANTTATHASRITQHSSLLSVAAIQTPCAGNISIQGAIEASDPTQTGRLFRDGIPDQCGQPVDCETSGGGSPHYDSYTFANNTGAARCVTVRLESTVCNVLGNQIFSGAYIPSFNPATICLNHVANSGNSPNQGDPPVEYSFNVPAGSTFVVVVHEVSANVGCRSYTLTVTGCSGAAVTPVSTNTRQPTSAATNTPRPGTTPAPCTLPPFSDVSPGNAFYNDIRCLVCRGVLSGFNTPGDCPSGAPCFGTEDEVKRGQAAKIIANAAGLRDAIPQGRQTFTDVPPGHVFYEFIERMAARQIITGFRCGETAVEPCDSQNRPYFRPYEDVKRGQAAKMIANAAGFNDPPGGQTFQDVPTGNETFPFVARLERREIVGGYACGEPGEPCVAPGNLPYFRPYAFIKRGQMSKIVGRGFFANECATGPGQ